MNKKEILKLIMILYGYDRNIEIDTINGFQSASYVVYGEGEDPEDSYLDYSEDFLMALTSLIDDIIDNKIKRKTKRKTDYLNYPISTLLNDDERMNVISILKQREVEHKEWWTAYEPVRKWRDENHPCPKCVINKKDHWDSIHYNCELCHTHQCPILGEFNNEFDKIHKKHLKK